MIPPLFIVVAVALPLIVIIPPLLTIVDTTLPQKTDITPFTTVDVALPQ